VIALDIAAFLPLPEFNARMEQLVGELKSVPRAAAVDEILFPGEPEARSEQELRAEGIALPEQTIGDLAKLAYETGTRAFFPC
jgi:LDH2 family malate/lactate/ureidoglycolate dehydrogenase